MKTYVVLTDRATGNVYTTEIDGGESIQMAARRTIAYHEIIGPSQFEVKTTLADDGGQAADNCRRPQSVLMRVKDVNGVEEEITRNRWQHAGMLYYNGPKN